MFYHLVAKITSRDTDEINKQKMEAVGQLYNLFFFKKKKYILNKLAHPLVPARDMRSNLFIRVY